MFCCISFSVFRYAVDFDLKKSIDESSIAPEARKDTRKALKKLFEEKYRNQSTKVDKKSTGAAYFFNKLRF